MKTDRQSFWQMQDQARGQTAWLMVVFSLVFVTTVAATVVATRVGLHFSIGSDTEANGADSLIASYSQGAFPNFFDLIGILLSGGVILIGALIKRIQLSDGGQVVAHMMGGRRLDSPLNPKERRLLNVVEEMSIASGIPVPPVYVLPNEPNINAFAAGLNPSNAVLGFSKGSIEKLSRDELQGVVAHEFSHIFNGDMRLNMRLITLIAGLQSISHIGRFLLDVDSRGSSSRKRDGQLALFAFVLLLIGLFGTFMAGIVKAAVSRQREYLADATAMQYTRNPHGIGGALLKIMKGDFNLRNYFAKEASHFLFASESSYLSLSTHPPLRDRVQRVAPDLLKAFEDGSLKLADEPPSEDIASPDARPSRSATAALSQSELLSTGFSSAIYSSKAFAEQPEPITLKAPPTSSLPVIESTTDAAVAIASILAFENLHVNHGKPTSTSSSVGEKTANAIKAYRDDSEFHERVQRQIASYLNDDLNTAVAKRSNILKLALPHARKMSKADRESFFEFAESLCRANDHVSIFEGTCLAVLRKAFALPMPKSNMGFVDCASHLLSAISNSVSNSAASTRPEDQQVDALKAFQAGRTFLISRKFQGQLIAQIRYVRAADQSGLVLAEALCTADRQSDKLKRTLLLSIECVAQFDRRLSVGEAELLRMIGLALDLPNPSLEG